MNATSDDAGRLSPSGDASLPDDRVRSHPPLRFGLGSAYSPLIDDAFNCQPQALIEADAVFIEGCDANQRWAGKPRFTVLQIGFGLGVNFLATLARWLGDPQRCKRLTFVSIEQYPVSLDDLQRALIQLNTPSELNAALLAQWPSAVRGIHRLRFGDGQVTLLLALGDATTMLPSLTLRADAVYLDIFALARRPEAWINALLRQIGRRCALHSPLSTDTSAAAVQRGLVAAGFEVSLIAACGNLRQRLAAIRREPVRGGRDLRAETSWPSVTSAASTRFTNKKAIVVGAGLAGCTIAATLVARGWRVTLIDAGPTPLPATAGSAQPLLAEHLHVSPDDNRLARLTRAGWSLSRTASRAVQSTRRPIGRLMMSGDESSRTAQRDALCRLGWPPTFARWVDADEASDLSGVEGLPGAIWWPSGAVVDPAERCRQLLEEAAADPAGQLKWIGSCRIARIGVDRDNDGAHHRDAAGPWRVYDDENRERASATVLVLANAGGAPALAGLSSIALQARGGQSTRLRAPSLAALRCAIGGDVYALPQGDGSVLTGATQRNDSPATLEAPIELRQADDVVNLDRLTALIGEQPIEVIDHHAGWRFATRDHLPVIGAVHDEARMLANPAPWRRNDRLRWPMREHLYLACAFGGRGLLWSTLAAELLASMIDDDALPLESELVAAISPERFLRRDLRRGAR